MKAVILSAGLGTRLLPTTKKIPKVLIKIGGKPVLEHLVILCKKHGIKNIVINLHYLPEKIKNYFDNGSKWGVDIVYSYEPQILGGAGALKKAEVYLRNGPFFVLNGDVMTNINLNKMAKFHKQKKGIGTLLVHKTDHPYDSDLVECDKKFLIKRFFRPKRGAKFKAISKTGSHIFESEILKFIPQGKEYSLEKELIPHLLKRGEKLYAYHSEEYSKDMGTPERLAQARKDYEEGKIKI